MMIGPATPHNGADLFALGTGLVPALQPRNHTIGDISNRNQSALLPSLALSAILAVGFLHSASVAGGGILPSAPGLSESYNLSVICGEGWNETKFNIETGVARGTDCPDKAYGRIERENEEFIWAHRDRIAAYVAASESPSDLKRIAGIVGYSLSAVRP